MDPNCSAFIIALPVTLSSHAVFTSPLRPTITHAVSHRGRRLQNSQWRTSHTSFRMSTDTSAQSDSGRSSLEGSATKSAEDDSSESKVRSESETASNDGNGRTNDSDDGVGEYESNTDRKNNEAKLDDGSPPAGDDGPPSKNDDSSSREGGNDDDSDDRNPIAAMLANSIDRLKKATSGKSSSFKQMFNSVKSTVSHWVSQVLENVPPPIIVALISLVSTVLGSRYKVYRDAKKAERERADASRKRREEIESHLRETYELYASPLLKSAAKLAERLEFAVNADWSAVENSDGEHDISPKYSAYLLGRFLSHVEILKRERALLDYGFPTADRILANILGRIQGVLCANDKTLGNIQQTEHFFKPFPGEKPLHAGPLKISPRKQTVLGELMLRRSWSEKYDIVKTKEGSMQHGPKAVLTFLEFCHIFEEDKEMKKWYSSVSDDFGEIERRVTKLKAKRRRAPQVGSRIYFLQSALLDLVEFFDPLPHPQSVPVYQRRRLQIGPNHYEDERRSPLGLRKLYGELAKFREHREHSNSPEKLAVPYGVEVFVTGRYDTKDPRMELSDHGNCPFSHRVLIALREMKIPFRAVSIAPDNKPAWFYLLHPMTQTPLIYHEGKVISESENIVSYLMEKFPDARPLASADHLNLAVGSSAFSRFHAHFMSWICGDQSSLGRAEYELRQLEETLKHAQVKNGGLPFFGGARFSREDTAVVPFLHNVEIAGRRIKHWSLPEDCVAVREYLRAARQMPCFSDSGAEEEAVVRRVQAIVGAREERTERLADMLE